MAAAEAAAAAADAAAAAATMTENQRVMLQILWGGEAEARRIHDGRFFHGGRMMLYFPFASEGYPEGYRVLPQTLWYATVTLQRKWRYNKFRECMQRKLNRRAMATAFGPKKLPLEVLGHLAKMI